jgi:ferredoxin
MEPKKIHYDKIKEESHRWGGDLFGVADLTQTRLTTCGLGEKTLRELPFGISIGTRLSDTVLEEIDDHPTLLYLHHYRQANYILDRIAFHVAARIQHMGGKALPIAASQIVDWEGQKGHLSHKGLARARIRLVSILTDLPLQINEPAGGSCGECRQCIPVCPAAAIKEKFEDFDHIGCFEKLKEFRNRYNIGQYICGVCIKACNPGG